MGAPHHPVPFCAPQAATQWKRGPLPASPAPWPWRSWGLSPATSPTSRRSSASASSVSSPWEEVGSGQGAEVPKVGVRHSSRTGTPLPPLIPHSAPRKEWQGRALPLPQDSTSLPDTVFGHPPPAQPCTRT